MSDPRSNNQNLETILLALSFLESEILKDGEVAKIIKETSDPNQLIVGLSAISGTFLVLLRNVTGRSEEDFLKSLRNKILDVNEG